MHGWDCAKNRASGQQQAATVQVRHWTVHREITIKEYFFFFFNSVYFQIGNYKGNFLSLRLAGVSTTPWARQSCGCNLSRSDVKHGNPGT